MRKYTKLLSILIIIMAIFCMSGCAKKYILTFDANGGTLENGYSNYSIEVKKNTTVDVLNAPTKEGYKFIGWYSEDTNSTITIAVTVNKNMTLKAVWEEEIKEVYYNVVYDLDGGQFSDGSTSKEEELLENTKVKLPTNITKEGFVFKGFIDISTDQMVEDGFSLNKNMTLKAVWEEEKYIITYKSKRGKFLDGTNQMQLSFEKGSMISYEHTPIIMDRIFCGWYDEETDELIYPGTIVTKNMTVYAKYKEVEIISKINYYTTASNANVVEDAYYEGIMIALPLLEKEGFKFLGWYNNEKLEGKPVFYQDDNVNGDTNYWAAWELIDENHVGDIFDEIVEDEIDRNLLFYNKYANTTIYWETSNYKIIDYIGQITRTHNNEKVKIKATITYNNKEFVMEKEVIVKAIQFKNSANPVAGYFYVTGVTNMTETFLENFDIAYFAFANVRSNGDVMVESPSQLNKFLNDAKTMRQRGIRIVLSIAGGADNFSAACRSKGSSYVAQKIIDLVVKYGFDGVDIDWEFPADASDLQRMNALCQSLRIKLDALVNEGGTPYLLTAAIPSSDLYSKFDLNTLNKYLDYVNMMSYDMNAAGLTTNLCPLYKANNDGNKGYGIDDGIDKFTRSGFDKNKIIIGAAFYGKSYRVLDPITNFNPKYPGLGLRAELYHIQYSSGTITYSYIVNNILPNRNYRRYWDDKAKASYLYNSVDQIFITFEDQESLIEKTKFAYENGLGIMFWEYGYDYKNVLTDTICNTMHNLKYGE